MLLSIDSTFIFVFVSFIIFVFLMKYICYMPFMRVMAERERFYAKNKTTVLETQNKKNQIMSEIENEISNAKHESSKLLLEAQNQTEQAMQNTISKEKEKIQTKMKDFEFLLEENSKNAATALKTECEDFVKSTVANVLGINKDEVKVNASKINEIIK